MRTLQLSEIALDKRGHIAVMRGTFNAPLSNPTQRVDFWDDLGVERVA